MIGNQHKSDAVGRDRVPVVRIPRDPPQRLKETWRQARVRRIAASLAAAQARPTGGWVVVGASHELRPRLSLARVVGGEEYVLWRDGNGAVLAGPGSCPHMGALLDTCPVVGDAVRCRWHGMALGPSTRPRWDTLTAHDDGILLWLRRPSEGHHALTDAPKLPRRPDPGASLAVVFSLAGACEPQDILANRLDPWHGAWLHPYAFSHLVVDEEASSPDRLVLDVAFRLGATFAVPVRADFTCPDAQTIVMTILAGEGAGSVVETHATLLTAPGVHPARTVMTEAVIATSDRPGFDAARNLSPVVRRGMRAVARRLWRDDLEYATRTYAVRRRGR